MSGQNQRSKAPTAEYVMRYLIRTLEVVALVLLLVLAGLGVYSLSSVAPQDQAQVSASTSQEQVWTCSMHPQIRKDKPGNCPICGMPLVPADSNKSTGSSDPMFTLSAHARAMASVETVVIAPRSLFKELRAVGKIQYNETGLATIVSRVDGYIERLYVDYTGVNVKKGDHLADIYSQELAASMAEMLVFSVFQESHKSLESSKARLRQFGMDEAQIEEVLRTNKPKPYVTLYSPINGTVVEKMVFGGSHVDRGSVLYRVANLESVWVLLDIYESEISWIQYGREVEIRTEAYSGEVFKGIITFISPTLHPETRTIKVRVSLPNPDRRLKPEMFVHATVKVPLRSNGKAAPSGLEGKYTCPMHPEVIQPAPGKCPICSMELEQFPGQASDSPGSEKILAVPSTAVLDSGSRKIVYVERAPGEFAPAEITVGPKAGDYYPVFNGLSAGQKVAVRGNFLIDSQFQINGLPSLFYPRGQAPAGGHQHGNNTPLTTPGKTDVHADHGDPAVPPTPAQHLH
jgi:membrane fusion protein, copper/silver efflux system